MTTGPRFSGRARKTKKPEKSRSIAPKTQNILSVPPHRKNYHERAEARRHVIFLQSVGGIQICPSGGFVRVIVALRERAFHFLQVIIKSLASLGTIAEDAG